MGKLLAIVVAAVLQPIPDPLLARFAGQWPGEGTGLEMPASVQLTWEWMLGGQFLRLTFVNQMGPSRRFEGHAYYRALGGGRYRGTWFDNGGMIRPIDASQVGERMRDFGRVVVRRARDSSSDSSNFRNRRKINHSNQD